MENDKQIAYYDHLTDEKLSELRYELQDRYQKAYDVYQASYQEWAIVMNALGERALNGKQ